MTQRSSERILAKSGWSARLPAGSRFDLVAIDGLGGGDLWVFNAQNPEEFLSGHHTRSMEGEIYPRQGWTFWSNERRPIMKFVADSSMGTHDCLVAACDSARYELLGAGSDHGSCEANLQIESAKYGFNVTHAPQPINVFGNFTASENGKLTLNPVATEPGDTATFELLMDAIVVISACPQDMTDLFPNGPRDLVVNFEAPA